MNKNASAVAARAAGITPSLTLSITAKAKKMKAEGISVIGFGAGEPDFDTPQYIIDAAKTALDKGLTKYTESSGILPLKKAIAEKLKNDNNITYSTKQIIVSNGAKHSLHNAFCAILNDGDEVILPSPYWLTYPELVKMAGGVPVYIKTDKQNGYKVTPLQLEKAITDKTKAFILNSPSNPTGAVYTEQELRALGEVLGKSGIIIISDEIYENLIYYGKHISIASLSEKLYCQTIVVNGVSKSYAMTGWRIGYLAASEEIAAAADAIQSHEASNPNTIAQYAALEAITNPEGRAFLRKMVATFDERRRYAVNRIKAINGLDCTEPAGAFYIMMDISGIKGRLYKGERLNGSIDIAEKMLDFGIAAVPGIAFGDDDSLRLSYAISLTDIKEGIDRIEKFINTVK